MTLVGSLPADLPASLFIVLHIPAQNPSLLPHILSRSCPLVALSPHDGEAIQQGRIYVAPPDRHLLVERGYVRLAHGPKENRHRPAIDPLFRSAARAYGARVVGVILTGSLDDGTAGLLTVKRRGGLAVVQDPKDALYPSMPLSALAHVAVDYTVPLSAIGPLLARLAHEQVEEGLEHPVSEDLEIETKLAEFDMETFHNEHRAGTPSAFSCPECGGVLWELRDGELLRFRCRVGHAFSLDSMIAAQTEQVEDALWAALKTLDESASLSHRMAAQAHERGQDWLARSFEEKQRDAQRRAAVIEQVLRRETPLLEEEGEAGETPGGTSGGDTQKKA